MSKQSKQVVNLLARHGSVQLFTQGFAFVSGILIVRSMEKDEYAGYAICIALLAAFSGMAEGGLNSNLMSIGGRIRTDRSRFSELYSSVLRFRLVMGLPIIVVGTFGVFAVLIANDFAWWKACAATVLTGLSMWVALNSGTVFTVLRLDYKFRFIRTTNLSAAIIRLALIALLVKMGVGGMETMLAIGLIVMLGTNQALRRRATQDMPARKPRMDLYKGNFKTAAGRVMPMNVALILSEQAVLVILTIYGATSSIAEIQAMARFGAIFVVVNGLLLDLATPYIARMAAGPELLMKGLMPILGTYAVLCAAVIVAGSVFSNQLLGILGQQYRGLDQPLVVILIGLALAQFSRAFGVLNQARGWLRRSWVYMPLIVVWLALCVMHLDLSTTMGAAVLMATQPVAELVTQIVRCISGNTSDRRAGRIHEFDRSKRAV